MTNSQILMAALAYSQCGSWREVTDSFEGLTEDSIRMAVNRAGENNPTILNALSDGKYKSRVRQQRRSKAENFIPHYHVRSDLALKRDREIYSRRISQPSPVTVGQKLMGEPLAGRSALENIETDGRGNVSKRQPRVSFGAISIPDIRINSHSN